MKIKVLKKEDMDKSVNMMDIIEADELALSIYSKGESDIPLRINLDIKSQNGQSLYMPGYADQAKALGIKIVAVYPDNAKEGLPAVPATMILQDAKTGIINCIMDGTYLTQLRTGAVSGLATKYLAKENSENFTIIGAGGQALTQILAVMAVRDIKKVRVIDLDPKRIEDLVEEVRKYCPDLDIKMSENTKEDIANSDIITLVTTAQKPVFDASLLSKGVHINSVGSYTPNMQETPKEVLKMADRIFLDTKDGVINESGDVINPLNEGYISLDKLKYELGDLINKTCEGRKSDDEITWFKTTGSAVLDIVAAQKIYELAKDKNLGEDLEI